MNLMNIYLCNVLHPINYRLTLQPLAYFLANDVFFAGYQSNEYTSLQDITREGKTILELNKQQMPTIKIIKSQNRNFRT